MKRSLSSPKTTNDQENPEEPFSPLYHGSLYKKRFSKDRRDYFTTNTRGELVKIESTDSQFKRTRSPLSVEQKLEITDEVKPPTKISCPRTFVDVAKVPEKSYSAIPDLSTGSIGLKELKRFCDKMSNTAVPENSDWIKYFRQQIDAERTHFKQGYVYFEGTSKSCEKPRREDHVIESPIVANHWSNWFRIREMFLQMIKAQQLDALLEADESEYAKYYDNRADFRTADDIMAYTLLNIVRFNMFQKRILEVRFFQGLRNSRQRTKYVLQYINMKTGYKYTLLEEGVSMAERVTVARALRGDYAMKEMHPWFSKCEEWVIKSYVQGAPLLANDEALPLDWAKSLHLLSEKNKKLSDQKWGTRLELVKSGYMVFYMCPSDAELQEIKEYEDTVRFSKRTYYLNDGERVLNNMELDSYRHAGEKMYGAPGSK